MAFTFVQIDRLRYLHRINFVHNDLKLDNIVIGHKKPHIIYLIDYGLSQNYLKDDRTHMAKKTLNKFTGNFIFASLNSCRGNTKSRRDDIESAMYILCFLINDQKLPWSNISRKFRFSSHAISEMLQTRLKTKYSHKLYNIIPVEIKTILSNVFNLAYEEKPPYDQIISLLKELFFKAYV